MKYITVTQENKSKNKRLFRGLNVGQIYKRGLPNSFNGVINQEGNYQNSQNHEADGWFDYVQPSYDEVTQYLGDVFFDVIVFTNLVVDKTQEAIDKYLQRQEDNDTASQFFNDRINKGVALKTRFSQWVYRKVVNNEVTKNQAVIVLEFFYDAILPLNDGYLELALKRVTALITANAGLLQARSRLLNQIQSLIDNE